VIFLTDFRPFGWVHSTDRSWWVRMVGFVLTELGDLCLWGYLEQKFTCLTQTEFDIRVGVKADGFNFYAINYRSFSEPINRP